MTLTWSLELDRAVMALAEGGRAVDGIAAIIVHGEQSVRRRIMFNICSIQAMSATFRPINVLCGIYRCGITPEAVLTFREGYLKWREVANSSAPLWNKNVQCLTEQPKQNFGKRWTEAEDAILLVISKTSSVADMALALGRTASAIKMRMVLNNDRSRTAIDNSTVIPVAVSNESAASTDGASTPSDGFAAAVSNESAASTDGASTPSDGLVTAAAVSNKSAPLSNESAPVSNESAPVSNESAPVSNESAALTERAAALTERAAALTEGSAPSSDEPTPVSVSTTKAEASTGAEASNASLLHTTMGMLFLIALYAFMRYLVRRR
jgi:hypothetical protein